MTVTSTPETDMTSTPIQDYALLSNRHGSALVSTAGSVDWLCLPRFDSPSILGRILDEQAGYWSIAPAGPYTARRQYIADTMVLLTTFTTDHGTIEITDALAVGDNDDPHHLGSGAPPVLLRGLRCTTGSVEVAMQWRPRPEYGLVTPWLRSVPGGAMARGGPVALALSASTPVSVLDEEITSEFTLTAGQAASFAMHVTDLATPPRILDAHEIGEQLATTIDAWQRWSALHQSYNGPWRDLVRHSGRVLQALSYQPTGAIVAAPTTSLPEEPGGTRNWDYRYTWIRDAAFSMDALWVAACPDEAAAFFSFMASAATINPHDGHIRIMYGVGGEYDLTERELPHLSGWRGSRPVRVGNGAASQHQVDVYGELMATAARFTDQLDGSDPRLARFLTMLADTAAAVWEQPDHGIWEIRGAPQHFLYSKLMCWVALDRALQISDAIGAQHRIPAWSAARQQIRAAIETRGWSPRLQAFRQSLDIDELDASALMMPIVGFIAGDDPRMLATIDTISDQLTDETGMVFRYQTRSGVDGLPGHEGTFLLCTFWLAQALALAGRTAQARDVFARAARPINDVGLLAEQVDPASGALWGNFPQAFSHIGLINAAYAIAAAEGRA